jgi:hypothetical protein
MMADAISGKLLTTDNIMPTHRPFLHSLGRKWPFDSAKFLNTVEINGVFLRFVRAPSFAG